MATSSLLSDDAWLAIVRHFPPDWRQRAKTLGFGPATRAPPGAVCPSPDAMLRTMLCLVVANLSLRTTAAAFAASGLVAVTHVAVHKWFRKAVPFLSFLLVSLTGAQRAFHTQRWAGYVVRAIDATTVQRLGAQGTTARIHYCLRLNDMACVQCIVTDEKVGETLRNFTTSEGVLDLADRGYSNPPSIAAAVDQHGDVLVRWNPPSLPLYDRRGRRYNPATLLRRLNLREVREWPTQVRPKGHSPIDARLVITRLPADKAAEARAGLRRRDLDKPPTAQMLFWAGFIMLVTTAPRTRLDAIAIAELYCLRWQIELQFKREKSVGGLDLLPNRRAENIKAWLLAKLLLSQIARRLVVPTPKQPPKSIPSSRSRPSGRRRSPYVPLPDSSIDVWECGVLAWFLLRSALLPVDWSHLQRFVRRFRAHLALLKRKDDQTQVATFLAFLGKRLRFRGPG